MIRNPFTLYSRSGADVITLNIPTQFRYGSSGSASRGTGVNLLTFYPALSPASDPANRDFGLSCAGYCNGRFLLSIENRDDQVAGFHESSTTIIARQYVTNFDVADRDPHLQRVELTPDHGFTRIFDVNIVTSSISGAIKIVIGNRYLVLSSSEKLRDYSVAAHCSMQTSMHGCEIYFTPKCYPGLLVGINGLSFDAVEQFLDVVSKVDKFVSAMVESPECKRN